jgi:hypothetical protein
VTTLDFRAARDDGPKGNPSKEAVPMTQPDAETSGSWLHRVRERIRGGRRTDDEARAARRRKRMHPERIGELKGQDKGDKHDPMSGVGGSW